jgi:hypothetical protein
MTTRLTDQQLHAMATSRGIAPGFVPKPERKKRRNEEWEIQRDVFAWWRSHASDFGLPPELYFAIPNGTILGIGNERYIRANMLKLSGMLNGAPDTLLCVSRGVWNALFVEYKTPTGRISDAQKALHPILVRMHYCVRVVQSVEEAKEAISMYLNSHLNS